MALLGLTYQVLRPSSGKHLASGHKMYGSVVSSRPACVAGATLDEIVLYSQQEAGSNRTIELKATLLRYKNAVGTILLCHGFMCDKTDIGFLRDLFPRGKYNIMTFDFRAHGANKEGQFCTLGLDERFDVIAAARFLQNYKPLHKAPLIVYGFSMGAVAAIMAEAEVKEEQLAGRAHKNGLFKAMVLDCPFSSVENVLKRSLENVKIPLFGYEFDVPGKGLLQQYAFHPYVQSFVIMLLKSIAKVDPRNIALRVRPIHTGQAIKKITTPICFIHCKNDEKVSVDEAHALFNGTASSYAELLLTLGRWHFDSFFYNPEMYKKLVNSFIELAIRGQLPEGQKVVRDLSEEEW